MPHFRTVLAAAALSAAALAPAAAQADAPWSAPAALPGSTTPSTGPLGAITARGTAALTYSVPSTSAAPAAQPTRLIRMDASGNVLGNDGLPFVAQGLAAYATTGLVAAGETLGTQYPGTIDGTSRLAVATMSGAGAVRTTTLPGLAGYGLDAVAGDAQGNVALVVFNTRQRLVYLRRKGASTFTKVLTIDVSPQARGATLTLGGRNGGEILVAYEDRHTLYVRHRGTRSWGAVHQLGPSLQSDISAAFDASGRESVAWKSQPIDEGESGRPAIVSFATAAPGHGFGARRQIESVSGTPTGAGHYVASPAVLLRVIDASHTLLTWTGASGGHFIVKAETISSGHTATPVALSPAGGDAVLDAASAAPSGAALVLWSSNTVGHDPAQSGPQPRITASYRAAGATAFGAPEPVSEAGAQQYGVTALLDPSTGRALAAWAPLTSGTQFATRPAN